VLLLEETVLKSKPMPLLDHIIFGLLIEVEASLKVESTEEEAVFEVSNEKFGLCKNACEP
jgi:hypothetical protein